MVFEKTGAATDTGCRFGRGTTLPRLTSNANGMRNLSDAPSQTQKRIFGEFLRSTNASNPAKSTNHDDCHRWLMMGGVVISISASFPLSVVCLLPQRPSPAHEYRQV